MDANTTISRARLEYAEALLREVLDRDFEGERSGSGGSLGRILIHLVNMNRAVSTSAEDHANVAKRLGDFALTTARITVPNPDSAARLTRLVDALNSAKAGLEESQQGQQSQH
jgi:hypothetical protein